jgi:hypothetical protein
MTRADNEAVTAHLCAVDVPRARRWDVRHERRWQVLLI